MSVLPTQTKLNYTLVLTNKRAYSYKIGSDSLQSKVDILENDQLSYLKDIPIELWLNWSGVWDQNSSCTTGRYGNCTINSSTSATPSGIANCLGAAVATIDDETYVSNIIRYNFYT